MDSRFQVAFSAILLVRLLLSRPSSSTRLHSEEVFLYCPLNRSVTLAPFSAYWGGKLAGVPYVK